MAPVQIATDEVEQPEDRKCKTRSTSKRKALCSEDSLIAEPSIKGSSNKSVHLTCEASANKM